MFLTKAMGKEGLSISNPRTSNHIFVSNQKVTLLCSLVAKMNIDFSIGGIVLEFVLLSAVHSAEGGPEISA